MIQRRLFTTGLLATAALPFVRGTGAAAADRATVGPFIFRPLSPVERKFARNLPNLLPHNYRAIQNLSYKVFYLGNIWSTLSPESPLYTGRMNIDTSLAAAMTDSHLNSIFSQYFPTTHFPSSVVTTTPPAQSYTIDVIDTAWPVSIDQKTLETDLLESATVQDQLQGESLDSFAVMFVLPPETVLLDSANESSLRGLGGYHSAYADKSGKTIYYGAVPWSDGENGAAKPHWDPWKNVCAGQIGDLPILDAHQTPQDVFQEVKLGNGSTAPIQFLWSNCSGKAWDPSTTLPNPCNAS